MNRILMLLFFIAIGPGSVLVYIPLLLVTFVVPSEVLTSGAVQFAGTLPIVVGLAITAWCFYDFLVMGKGTPVPVDPPKELVVHGLFGYVRNPIYIGICLILLGEAILFRSWILLGYACCIFLLFHLFVVFFEEPSLKSRFGKSYENYCQSVPRWLPVVTKKSVG